MHAHPDTRTRRRPTLAPAAILPGALLPLLACAPPSARAQEWPGFIDRSADLGTSAFSFTGNNLPGAFDNNENYYDGDFADFDGDGRVDRGLGARYGLLKNMGGARMTPYAGPGLVNYLFRGVLDNNWGEDAFQWADVDNDGDLDIFQGGNGEPFVLQVNAAGRFRTQWVKRSAASALNIVNIDIENDGDVDLAVAHAFCSDRLCGHGCPGGDDCEGANWPKQFHLWVNDGAGNYTDEATARGFPADFGEDLIVGVVAGDVDGDRDFDLLLINGIQRGITLARNDGTGRFTLELVPFAVALAPIRPIGHGFSQAMNLGDIDDDGDLDLVVALVRDSAGSSHPKVGHAIFVNDGGGGFADETAARFNADEYTGAFLNGDNGKLVDLDYDGDFDFVVFDSKQARLLQVYLNEGDGTFTYRAALSLTFPSQSAQGGTGADVDVTDIDGDGTYDVWVGAAGSDVRILANPYRSPDGLPANVPRDLRVVSAGAEGVTLAWNHPPYADVARWYKVYRSTAPGLAPHDAELIKRVAVSRHQDEGFAAPLTRFTTTAYLGDPEVVLDGAANEARFTDATAGPGVTYYYTVTHVGTENTESRPAAEVAATIPAPPPGGADTAPPVLALLSPTPQDWSVYPRIVILLGDGGSGVDPDTLRVSFDAPLGSGDPATGGRPAGADLSDLFFRKDGRAYVAAIQPPLALPLETLVTLTASVADRAGNTAAAEVRLFPGVAPDGPPDADIVLAPAAEGQGPLAVNLSASGSSDTDGEVFRSEWYFDDGATAVGPEVTKTFAAPGSYRVTLLVRDNSGAVATAERTVTVGGEGAVTGTVSGAAADGSPPLPGARLTLFTEDLRTFRETRSDAAGTYRFDAVAPGTYRLGVALPGRAYQEVPAEVAEGVLTRDFALADEAEPGRWTVIGDTAPEFLKGTGSGSLLPNGEVLFCHDTEDPVAIDPAAGAKRFPPASGSVQGCHAITLGTDGGLRFIGGSSMNGNPQDPVLDAVKAYDVATDSWRAVSNFNLPRWYPSVVRLPGERLLLIGGEQDGAPARTNTCETYDPATGRWSFTGSFDLPAEMPPSALLYTGEVFKSWRDPELYDPTAGTWRPAAPTLQARPEAAVGQHSDHSNIVLPDGRYMALGIAPAPGNTDPRFAEIYDPAGDAWSLAAPNRTVRVRPESILLPDGRVLALGGEYLGDDPAVETGRVANIPNPVTRLCDLYDPTSDTWREVAPMNRFIHYHNVTVLAADGRVVATAGAGAGGLFGNDNSVEAFEPPYLFRGIRPRIDGPVTTDLRPGISFSFDVSFAEALTSVVLLGTRNATHWIDGGPQRYLRLAFNQEGGRVTATVPGDEVAALAGYYLLFALVDDVPSEGQIVRVLPAATGENVPPVVDAGPAVDLASPDDTASLAGSASDPDGGPGALTVTWSQLSGPGEVTFADSASATTTATFSAPGNYRLRLTADDSAASASDEVSVTVGAGVEVGPIREALVGEWLFDEGAGTTAADSSGSGRSGTLVAGPGWIDGRSGAALLFDGANDRVEVNDFPTPASFTLSAWIRPEPNDGTDSIIANKHNSEYDFRLGTDGHLAATVAGTTVRATGLNFYAPASAGRWHHVALTFEGETRDITLFIDGAPAAEGRADGLPADTHHPLWIGRHSQFNFGTFPGAIDEVRLHGRVLRPFELWRYAGFPAAPEDEGAAGPAADPDADGLPNLVEYFMGLDPGRSDAAGATSVRYEAGAAALRFSFLRSTDPAAAAAGRVQWSEDLVSWNDLTPGGIVGVEAGPPGSERVTAEVDIDGKTVFVRLAVRP